MSCKENLEVSFHVKWNGKDYEISLPITCTVMDLKLFLLDQTGVPLSRQKLMGLKLRNNSIANESTRLEDLIVSPTTKIMMMGSPEDETQVIAYEKNVLLDWEDDPAIAIEPKDCKEYHQKINSRIKSYSFTQLNEPRSGKKLLVLDIDYTLFDHRSSVEHVMELMRPHLHEFLTAAYAYYDIFIWSATSMKWILAKMGELGVLLHSDYKITALVDYGAMITVHNSKYGIFNSKPLQVIWARYSDFYSPKNTIMFDDLGRNFIMNPQNGLKITPYKNAPINCDKDDELIWLKKYLLEIAKLDDFSLLNHKYWRDYLNKCVQ